MRTKRVKVKTNNLLNNFRPEIRESTNPNPGSDQNLRKFIIGFL